MCSATQFNRPGTAPGNLASTAHLDHPNLVTIFLAKQCQRTKFDRSIRCHDSGRDIAVHADTFIDDGLHLRQFLSADSAGVREVKTQPVGRDQRAFLGHMVSQHMPQRLVKKMCRRMVGAQLATTIMVNIHAQAGIRDQGTGGNVSPMHEHAGWRLECISHNSAAAIPCQAAGITLLTARFGIKRGLVCDHRYGAAGGRVHLCTINDKRCDLAFGAFGCVAKKLGTAQPVTEIQPDRLGCAVA